MTELSSRTVLGLNQQTYQRLKLALSLNLRRQIFIAVCDDLPLRDRLATRLQADLAEPSLIQVDRLRSEVGAQRYPRLVSLRLNLNDPNPIVQIAQWLSQSPPPRSGKRRLPLPAFQFLGIEQLTRQPAAVQRLFLTHLQSIERSLPVLDSSLLFWMPQPWFRTLPQSAQDFWRCRTAVFEFVGDPTPITVRTEIPVAHPRQPARPVNRPVNRPVQQSVGVTPAITTAVQVDKPPQDLWSILTDDLTRLKEVETQVEAETVPKHPPTFLIQPTKVPPVASAVPVGGHTTAAVQTVPKPTVTVTVKTEPVAPNQQQPGHTVLHPPLPDTEVDPEVNPVDLKDASLTALTNLPEGELQPALLRRQIDLLLQQQASPTHVAEAYRQLGNWYRDRIEQGETSPENLSSAIQAYEQVLVWLHEGAEVWSDVLNDLGNLYWLVSRKLIDPEQSLFYLKQGIQAYQLALSKLNPKAQPHSYPMIQNNLGAAYSDLARYENQADNLQRSIQAYQQALRHREPAADPIRYASTQNNLGTTYWNLAQHEQPAINLKQAIASYSEALRYCTVEQDPLSYGMIQNNLGTASWNLAQHERPQEWLKLAISAYQVALQYRTQNAAPVAFAATQNNLGTAYLHLSATWAREEFQERASNLQQAIQAYETAIATAQQLQQSLASSEHAAPLNFDLFATHNNLALAHYQIATDPRIALEGSPQSTHLKTALQHHLTALQGWQKTSELRQAALAGILQTIRALYNQCGLEGQSFALSTVPAQLLPEILPKL